MHNILEKYLQEYRQHGLSIQQIEQVKKGFESGLTTTQVDVYAKSKFNSLQMEEIRLAFEDGLSFDDVDKFSKVEFGHEQMNHVRIKIRNEKKLDEDRNAELTKKHLKNLILFSTLVVVLVIAILVGLFAREEISLYFQDLKLVLTDKKITLNYNDPFISMNYIKEYSEGDNIELILPGDISTNILGTQKVLYKIKNAKKVVSVTLEVEVIDTILPEIQLTETDIYNDKFYKGCQYYIKSALDNVDGNIKDRIECYEDGNKIIYKYTDSSNNTITETINFNEVPKCNINAYWNGNKCVCNAEHTGDGYSCVINKPQIVEKPVYIEKVIEVPSNSNSSNNGGETTYDSGWIYETIDGVDGSGNAIVKWE